MTEGLPKLAIVNPRMRLLDLVALARSGSSADQLREFITETGVEINARFLKDPEVELNLQSGDVLRLGVGDWHQIEVVDVNKIETERLLMLPLEMADIDALQKHLPEWDIVKYLSRKLSGAIKPEDVSEREIFKKIISQAPPKNEWMWKIMAKQEVEKIIGVAHLARDSEHGNQNVWLAKEHRGQGLTGEAVAAINEHAFNHLEFHDIHFKEAFSHAAAGAELDHLRKSFMGSADEGSEHKAAGAPEKSWGLSKAKWQTIKEKIKRPVAPVQPPAAPPQVKK